MHSPSGLLSLTGACIHSLTLNHFSKCIRRLTCLHLLVLIHPLKLHSLFDLHHLMAYIDPESSISPRNLGGFFFFCKGDWGAGRGECFSGRCKSVGSRRIQRQSWKQRDIDLFVCAFATSLLALTVKEIDGEMGSYGLHCFFLATCLLICRRGCQIL